MIFPRTSVNNSSSQEMSSYLDDQIHFDGLEHGPVPPSQKEISMSMRSQRRKPFIGEKSKGGDVIFEQTHGWRTKHTVSKARVGCLPRVTKSEEEDEDVCMTKYTTKPTHLLVLFSAPV